LGPLPWCSCTISVLAPIGSGARASVCCSVAGGCSSCAGGK
jgi:hypothetical protein